MTMYTALVYPVTAAGQGYTRPPTPQTFVALFATSPTWNPYSAVDADRTEYWEDTAGTMSLSDVELAMWGLSGIQNQQIAKLSQSYLSVVGTDVTYTTIAGVTNTYQADKDSMDALVYTIAGTTKNKATPVGFYWNAVDNTQVPFTYDDLYGLADAMFTKGGPAFQHLQTLKQQVRAATTVADIQAIAW